jgi:hypothetical protein
MMTSSDKVSVRPKRDHAAFAFLIAMGLAVAVVTGASLSSIASGAAQRILRSAGFGQNAEIKAEQHRQSLALAKIETSLGLVHGEITLLNTRADSLALASAEQAARQLKSAGASASAAAPGPSAGDIELTALRTSLDEHDQHNRQEFIAVNKRIDWLETLVYSHEATGSVQRTAVPSRRRIAKSAASHWFILHAEDGVAVIGGKTGTIDVTPGYVVPELGRVSSVEQRDGHWVVVTEKGTIKER